MYSCIQEKTRMSAGFCHLQFVVKHNCFLAFNEQARECTTDFLMVLFS